MTDDDRDGLAGLGLTDDERRAIVARTAVDYTELMELKEQGRMPPPVIRRERMLETAREACVLECFGDGEPIEDPHVLAEAVVELEALRGAVDEVIGYARARAPREVRDAADAIVGRWNESRR